MNDAPARGLLLHLSGPLQSYGASSRFHQRDTAMHPTRSALIGMIAAAHGYGREDRDALARLREFRFAVRIDRPGSILRDFHTVGGGVQHADQTVVKAEGGRRKLGKGTIVTERYYLQDAAFTVAATCDDPDLLNATATALEIPHWASHLGRRACRPDLPILLGLVDQPWHHLVRLPLHLPTDAPTAPLRIEYVSDRPLTSLPIDSAAPVQQPAETPEAGSLTDDPLSFAEDERRYAPRPVYRRSATAPHSRRGGLGADYLRALTDYLTPILEANTHV